MTRRTDARRFGAEIAAETIAARVPSVDASSANHQRNTEISTADAHAAIYKVPRVWDVNESTGF
jgi:hypothetical protein